MIHDEMTQLYEEVDELNNKGKVVISKLIFPPKEKPLLEQFNKKAEFNQWFVCILSLGTKITATEAILPDQDGFVRFKGLNVTFDNLPPHFEIKVTLYSMKVKNNLRNYSHESKFHLNKEVKKVCPSPKKFLHIHKDLSKKNLHTVSNERIQRHPSFLKWGEVTLRISDLQRNNVEYQMKTTPMISNLSGSMLIEMLGEVKLNETYSGFLTMGSEAEGCPAWNRRWCSLRGAILSFWNYPHEEQNNASFLPIFYI